MIDNTKLPTITYKNPLEKNFFFKELDYLGIKIKSSQKARDEALLEAYKKLVLMLQFCPAIANNMSVSGAEMHILAYEEVPSDLPDHRSKKGVLYEGGLTFDEQYRGLGGLRSSCTEENLLKLSCDKRSTRDSDICTHEYAHTICTVGLNDAIRNQIKKQYRESMAKGKWISTYASTNPWEFFCELSVWYFGGSGDRGSLTPKPLTGRAWLQKYDPQAFSLLDRIYSGKLQPRIKVLQIVKSLPPTEEHSLKSQINRRSSTTLIIDNQSNDTIKLYWLDYLGNRRFCSAIEAMDRYVVEGFIGHPYLITNEEEQGMAIFISDSKAGLAVIDSTFKANSECLPKRKIIRRYRNNESEISSTFNISTMET